MSAKVRSLYIALVAIAANTVFNVALIESEPSDPRWAWLQLVTFALTAAAMLNYYRTPWKATQ